MPLTEFQKQVLAVLVANRSEESHFAGGLVLHAAEGSARFSHDFDIFHEVAEEVTRASSRDVASLREAGYNVETLSKYGEWEKDALFRKAIVSCGKDPGFSPLSLLKMMRRFARIDPAKLDKIKARELDPFKLKEAWIEMSDYADAEMTRLADDHPEIPMGVAFVDGEGKPGWIGENPALRIHSPSVRGCLPTISEV